MGEDDDMVKKVVYLGRTLEWGRERLERTAGLKTRGVRCCESWERRVVEVPPCHCAPPWRRKDIEVIVLR